MASKLGFFLLILLYFRKIYGKESYFNQISLTTSDHDLYKVKVKNYSLDCSQIQFIETDKLNAHLGSLKVFAIRDGLNVTFENVKWQRAYLKLTNLQDPSKNICKMYSVENTDDFPIISVSDSCFGNLLKTYIATNYMLEFKAELNTEILYKRIFFKTPEQELYNSSIPLQKRPVFMSVDASSNYEISLKIQTLPQIFGIKYYKIEVFREKQNQNILLDVRFAKATNNTDELKFQYTTYNEEGYYFFTVSVLNDVCTEDVCFNGVSPKVYIRRKYPPLVIGIVGASFMIPFVLFLFHMWTRRCQTQEPTDTQPDRVFLIHNQSPEKHCEVVKLFEKTLRNLTKVHFVKDIRQATHVVYLCGTYIFEPDPATYKYLMLESQKRDIFFISFPYSVQDTPTYLKNCVKFEFMQDFGKFINIFNCEINYSEDFNYKELVDAVKLAQNQSEPMKIILNTPTIIVTADSMNDVSEIDPEEADGLL